MTENTETGIHWSFWAIGVFALLWNGLGAVNYVMQMNADDVATMPETHQAIINTRPAWATGGFAIGVFVGALGGALLLMRRSAAFHMFVASLIGVLVTMIHTVKVANSVIDFSRAEIFVMIVLPVIVAAFLVWYTRHIESRSWLR